MLYLISNEVHKKQRFEVILYDAMVDGVVY